MPRQQLRICALSLLLVAAASMTPARTLHAASEGEACLEDTECTGGEACTNPSIGCFCDAIEGRCLRRKAVGEPCGDNRQCLSDRCVYSPERFRDVCVAPATTTPTPSTGPSIPRLTNPLGQVTVPELIGRVIRALLGITGSIALAIFVWGGFVWLTSGGSPEKIDKGKRMLVWAVLGLALIFGAFAITNFVIDAITGATSGSATRGAGAPSAACGTNEIACGGRCVNPRGDENNCGGCGNVCSDPTPVCIGGACTVFE